MYSEFVVMGEYNRLMKMYNEIVLKKKQFCQILLFKDNLICCLEWITLTDF